MTRPPAVARVRAEIEKQFRPESEKQFQRAVLQLVSLYGWIPFHPWLSIHSVSGWPDLFLVRPPRALAAELKTERGKVSPAQAQWLGLLESCGIPTYVWRPSDKQRIAEVLR